MRPTFACLSKASRRPLTPKRGNKDYYKGTRQASLPGLRTGAPGTYFGSGKAQYKLLDERVRVFVAPPVEELNSTPLKPYVQWMTHIPSSENNDKPFIKYASNGITGEKYLKLVQSRRLEAKKLRQEGAKDVQGQDQAQYSVQTQTQA